MVLIRQRTKKSPTAQIVIPLVIGFFIGSLCTKFTLKANSRGDTSGLVNVAKDEFQTSISSVSDEDSGWHPIFVYYGKAEALKKIKTPMIHDGNRNEGSQVKQDEIINNLINSFREAAKIESGEKPYFVDLAANDAAALSNTFRLEKNYNWKGLCIEPNPGMF